MKRDEILRALVRRAIGRTLNETRKGRSRSLSSVIFEDASPEIEKAFSGGPAAVRSLANSAKDREDLKDSLQGDFDGESQDDVVAVNSDPSVKVGGLKPTQNEIDLVKSIGWPLGDFKTLEGMIKTGTSTAPGSITVSGDLVLDGHHRWSGIWSISGPEGTVAVDDLKLPGSTAEKLAAAQLAIAAYKPADAEQPSASDPIDLNILGKSPDAIEKDILAAEGQKDPKAPGAILNSSYLEKCAGSSIVADWAGFEVGDEVEIVKNAIVKKVASNLAGLPSNDAAPARADMPQFDHDDIGGKKAKADIIAGLQAGEFNVQPPFGPSGKDEGRKDESKRTDGSNLMLERWQRLAGIIR
jgi:hypothetical protein